MHSLEYQKSYFAMFRVTSRQLIGITATDNLHLAYLWILYIISNHHMILPPGCRQHLFYYQKSPTEVVMMAGYVSVN
jgi:hypothetical protein